MKARHGLTDRLRDRIVSALHLGHLHAGDRLPSIRQVAAETGANGRAVARSYRVLEAEGLVEVRDRSGIFAARQPRVGGVLLEETAQWAARVLVEGWKRGIALPDVPAFLGGCATGRRVRCAFVESCRDVVTAFVHDLSEGLGLDAQSVHAESLPRLDAGTSPRQERVPSPLGDADLVVTTLFHAAEVGPVAQALGKPMIAATVNAELVAAVERQIAKGALTVICADPGFGQRIRVQYQELVTPETRLHVIHVDDARGIAALDCAEPVLLTRAARQRLGKVSLPLVFPHAPTISASSALEIAEFLIRFNLERAAESAPGFSRQRSP
ncbi:MAG TPA: GntR family transcriptional regulator [Longimicrobium sp.]|nr:GntR family transcriptional regulator [Longimicrobium sp.]